jgi:DNA replication protein DnaC
VNGAGRLLDAGWDWRAGVDLAQVWRQRETYQPVDRPEANPLRAPYLDRGAARGPLQLLRADYRVVEFQPRDELRVLRHWCDLAKSGRQTRLAIIDGTGGSGKTRLALKLAQRLCDQGWYAGLLLHSGRSHEAFHRLAVPSL